MGSLPPARRAEAEVQPASAHPSRHWAAVQPVRVREVVQPDELAVEAERRAAQEPVPAQAE